MVDDNTHDTSGKPIYEKSVSVAGPKFGDKTAKSYSAEDIGKYRINKPIRDVIHAIIVKHEVQEIPCIISEETKTTE
jgi:hypothetical protein